MCQHSTPYPVLALHIPLSYEPRTLTIFAADPFSCRLLILPVKDCYTPRCCSSCTLTTLGQEGPTMFDYTPSSTLELATAPRWDDTSAGSSYSIRYCPCHCGEMRGRRHVSCGRAVSVHLLRWQLHMCLLHGRTQRPLQGESRVAPSAVYRLL